MSATYSTAGLEEKHEAVGNLILLTQAIGSSLPLDALRRVLEVAHPLLKFYFHMGVRESAAALIAVCVRCELVVKLDNLKAQLTFHYSHCRPLAEESLSRGARVSN